jgi:hypothetical protein
MAGFTLTRPDVFPEGTEVGVYAASNWPPTGPPSGAPIGSAADTQEVEDGSVTFSGLTQGAVYYAVAEVGGVYRYVGFVAGAEGTVVDPFNEQSGDYTVVPSDDGKIIYLPNIPTGAGVKFTVTIPAEAKRPIPVGTTIRVLGSADEYTEGEVLIKGEAGVEFWEFGAEVENKSPLKIKNPNHGFKLIKIAPDTWLVLETI